jgi:hypothetical protein
MYLELFIGWEAAFNPESLMRKILSPDIDQRVWDLVLKSDRVRNEDWDSTYSDIANSSSFRSDAGTSDWPKFMHPHLWDRYEEPSRDLIERCITYIASIDDDYERRKSEFAFAQSLMIVTFEENLKNTAEVI